jgi:methionyl-tRNA formyltransferase
MTVRVLFITEDDPLYVIEFFEVFAREYPRDEIEIVGITISRAFNEPRAATARRVLRFYGPVDFARLSLRVAAAKLRRRSIERLAREHGFPLVPTDSVNDPAYLRGVRALEPDVIVSVAAPEIFREALLGSARLGCINIHSGRLPRYRGMMPTFWQMVAGEPALTLTVHEMAAELDAGAVLGTLELPIPAGATLAEMMLAGKREGARLVIQVLRDLASGNARPRPLDMAQASYFSFPQREEAAELRRAGHRLL